MCERSVRLKRGARVHICHMGSCGVGNDPQLTVCLRRVSRRSKRVPFQTIDKGVLYGPQ